jgi:hypothetical protein
MERDQAGADNKMIANKLENEVYNEFPEIFNSINDEEKA